jgi:long-chain acyl-CoA synthetase
MMATMNLSSLLVDSAANRPDGIAVRLDTDVLTYGQLDDLSARLAGGLARSGLHAGDRVGLMLPNSPAWPVAYYAVLRAGGTVVPINPLLKSRELTHYLVDSGARCLLASGEQLAAAEQPPDVDLRLVDLDRYRERLAAEEPLVGVAARDPHDTAVILYTSGTTGRPKGAELTHDNLTRNATVTATTLFGLGPGDVVLGCLPLFHSFGQTCALNASVRSGATLTLLPRFDAGRALELMARDSVTVFAGVPTMYTALLHHPGAAGAPVPSLRLCVSGGAALPVEVLCGFEATFGTMILEGYGLSETSPVACFNHPDRPRQPGSIGTPIEGVEMRLVDEDGSAVAPGEVGEIAIRGHNVMKAYWGQPEATAAVMAEGWFRTGDLGRRDEDGNYYVVDRKKDLIIRGGFNVYPREVEEVLYEHPAVAAVAVVGTPDARLGEEVGAAVVRKAGMDVTEDELREFVKARLAGYKYPRHVWFVEVLPTTATGKIMRREVEVPTFP